MQASQRERTLILPTRASRNTSTHSTPRDPRRMMATASSSRDDRAQRHSPPGSSATHPHLALPSRSSSLSPLIRSESPDHGAAVTTAPRTERDSPPGRRHDGQNMQAVRPRRAGDYSAGATQNGPDAASAGAEYNLDRRQVSGPLRSEFGNNGEHSSRPKPSGQDSSGPDRDPSYLPYESSTPRPSSKEGSSQGRADSDPGSARNSPSRDAASPFASNTTTRHAALAGSRRSKPRMREVVEDQDKSGGSSKGVPPSRKPFGESVATERSPLQPQLPNGRIASRTPASAMYYSRLPFHGDPPRQALRAHTGTLVGSRIWFIGGVDSRTCWRQVAWFDTECLQWSIVSTSGEALPPLRAHTTNLVGDKLFIFGGGDGPTYSNEVWVLDTVTRRFSQPEIVTSKAGLPPPRRAHTTVLYQNYLVVFGGGNGQAALNDVWALDVSDPTRPMWQEWKTKGDIPHKKGYHTANLVGDKMLIFGGSDGHASFADIHVLDLRSLTWTLLQTETKHNRLSHTSTQVGSYLFVIGGHNGQSYAQDLLLFNLVTLQWESKSPKGVPPPGRGYHVALLHDARIFISGGYNGVSVFDDLWCLELAAGAYLPQVTTFEVDESG